MGWLTALKALLGGANVVSKIASTGVNTLSAAALVPVAIAVLHWLSGNTNTVITTITVTYGNAAFFGVIGFGILKLVHYIRSPGTP